MSEIAKWFSNKSVFVTGATGFVGKCLVEKLLRDCPDIDTIYIIIRSKKGVSFEQRKTDYKNHVVFSNLMNTKPIVLDKIHIVEGDICAPNLGISNANRKLIAETASIIFHSAADVRFDRRLVDAYDTNVRGSKAILDFATEFKELKAFVLISTAFSQIKEVAPLEERHYETDIRPELVNDFVENIDADMLDALTPKILGRHPNTYSFTKGLVEQLVYDYKDKFPTAVARPSIVMTAWKEPHLGYTEGLHGVNGWSLASGHGLLRSMLCQEHLPCNVMPADIVANAIIVLAYECGKRYEKCNDEWTINNKEASIMQVPKECDEPLYFNITEENPKSWKQYLDVSLPKYFKFPFNRALWIPGGSFKRYELHHFISVILLQVFPAILIDLLLILLRRPPAMLKVQRMVCAGCRALEYYQGNLFIFKADNYNAAMRRLNSIDRNIFYDRSKMDLDKYCLNAAYGTKIYLAKDKPDSILQARALHRRLWLLDISVKFLFFYWILKTLFSYFDLSTF